MSYTKQDLKDILEHIKIVIYKVWDANKERLRLETYALGIIEDIEGAIEQRFEELEKRLDTTPNTVGIPKCFDAKQMKGKQIP